MRVSFALVAVVIASACVADDPRLPAGRATPTPVPPAAPGGLVYVERTVLKRYDPQSGESERLGRLPSADVAVSPDGARYVVVEETSPQGPGPEGFRDPALLVGELSGEAPPAPLGPGRAPLWSPDGTLVAAIAPDAAGAERVLVYRPGGADAPETVLAGDLFTLIGWSGDAIIAASTMTGKVFRAAPGAEPATLDVALVNLWGASPTGDALLVVADDRASFRGPDGVTDIALERPALGDGAFSPDGALVAAAVVEPQATRLVMIEVATGAVTEVPESDGTQGQVVWEADGDRFAYARTVPGRAQRLEAVVCTTDLACERAFEWAEGVQLLSLSE
ncbi:MAG: hypothetical protein ACRDKB_11365 [Actinomycetota bacterium]